MSIERTALTYGPGVTSASRSVLLELMTVLRAYRQSLILVGGWVPYLLLEQCGRPGAAAAHVGSIDIDIAVDPARLGESEYATISELLRARGYKPAVDRRGGPLLSSIERVVHSPVTKKPYTIRIDFLTHQAAAPSASRHHVPMQDALYARKIKGCEAAFRHYTSVRISGVLPDGGELTVPIRMADLTASLTMKGIVLGERYREKDAYDIYMLLAHHQQGPRGVAEVLRPYLDDPLVSEGMANIRAAFCAREAHGPAWVAAFLVNPFFTADRERLITEAFMVVREFDRCLLEQPHGSGIDAA